MPTKRTCISDAVHRLLPGRNASDAVVANVLTIDLHADGEVLKKEVCRNIERMSGFSDGILVLYGVCDSLKNLERDCAGCPCPLYFLTDEERTKVEDCIALALGGNHFRWEVPSIHRDVVFFFTPMWASKLASIGPDWQTLLNYGARKAEKSARNQEIVQSAVKLLKHTRFKKVAKIDTDLRYGPNFDEIVYDYAQQFKQAVIQLRGTTDIVERCYQRARDGMRGRP